MRHSVFILPFVISTAAFAQHEHPASHSTALGTVDFKSSAAPSAQAPFATGVALLHSFEYRDASTAFRGAAARDPGFALAYWFDALTNRQPLWGTEDLAGARAALSRLGPNRAARLAKAHDPRERMYGSAVEALFAEAAELARVSSFSDTLVSLAKRYPQDLEAAAFASLGLLAKAYLLRDSLGDLATSDAIAFASRVYRANPRHPGATHYLIHAYDDPKRAREGLAFARAYAGIAPDAEHALHMPSHIFLQVGLWDDVVASNERSWAASRAWAKAHELPGDVDFHSLNWLQYGYLQQGRAPAARALIDTADVVLAGARNAGADGRYAPSQLAFRYGAETGDWSVFHALTFPTAPSAGASPRERTFARNLGYQRAIVAALGGDTTAARTLAAPLKSDATNDQIDAIAARAEGNLTREVAVLTRAAERETGPLVGPPATLIAHEMLGDALLRAGRSNDAARVYEASLLRTPNRVAAVTGLKRARGAGGN